jgi:LuxR family maltose regulon positive regulatory protein
LGATALLAVGHDQESLDARVESAVARALAEALEAEEIEFLRRAVRADPARAWLAGVLLASIDAIPHRPATSLQAPLTSRESVVLRCLPTLMSNPEIADELFISINTVKSHLRSIYRKLGTATRRETVQRARELQLIA